MFDRPIASSLSPNAETDDVLLAVKTLFTPWRWKRGPAINLVAAWFEQQFPHYHAFTFNSGRSSMFAILQSFGIGTGDEVIVQAFTCVAAVEPILWIGAKPMYADINKHNFNLDPKGLGKLITKKTKAIVVQHTFGIPADMDVIGAIAKKYKLLLIEDCAHSLGATHNGKKVGSFGDAAFFSFGRDKIVSSVFGGVAIIKSKCKDQTVKINKIQKELPYPSSRWIGQQMLHPILLSIILPLYNCFSIGKFLLVLFQRLQLLSKPIFKEEYIGGKPAVFPKKMPNALATLAYHQLGKLERFNNHRVNIAKQYGSTIEGAIYLRYPLLMNHPQKLYQQAKKKGILLGRWYGDIIDPQGVDLVAVGYQMGSCPVAEDVAKHIINLPTYPTMEVSDAKQVASLIKNEH